MQKTYALSKISSIFQSENNIESDVSGARETGSGHGFAESLLVSPPLNLMLMSLSEDSEVMKGNVSLLSFLGRDIQARDRHVHFKELSGYNTWQMIFELP